jgi:adenylylsulfate kinase
MMVIWLTGLPCCGKTTIANEMMKRLENEYKVQVIDGDSVRDFVQNQDFSPEGRRRHLDYISLAASLLISHDVITICSFVSPERAQRNKIIERLGKGNIIEVFVKCSVEKCIERDVKGMYKKALAGEIKEFTGVSAPYEEPFNPSITVDTEKQSLDECVNTILEYIGVIHG